MSGRVVAPLALTLLLWSGGVASAMQDVEKAQIEARLLRTWTSDNVTIVDGLANVPLGMLAGSVEGTYRFELTVFDASESALFRDSWERHVSDQAAAYVGADGSFLGEYFRFGVRPGEYEVELAAYPIDAPDLGTRVRLPLTGFADRPPASDLFLAGVVEPIAEGAGGGNWSITHGGFGIGATPRTVVMPDDPNLYYYLELYSGEAGTGPALISAQVLDGAGRSLYETPPTSVDVPDQGVPFTGSINLAGLPPGDYELTLSIEADDVTSARAAEFSMLDTQRAAVVATGSDGGYELEYFNSLGDEELLATFGGVAVLVGETERDVYEALPPDAKRRYLAAFFRSQDPEPARPGNAFLEEYLERIGIIRARYDENVGTEERAPWATARGRLYLRLGEPSDRVVNYSPSDVGTPTGVVGAGGFGGEAPYEIWQYHNTSFVYLFISDNRFGAWRLIYTTDTNMTSQADWAARAGPEALRDLRNNYGIQPR